ncbi:MAG: hypothetical protein LBN36_03695 [Clostridiales Family XIII bacterium]|jgi:hypothetical protein|nr:hypothetical protein [Clostridiales Family XIII bacterium]
MKIQKKIFLALTIVLIMSLLPGCGLVDSIRGMLPGQSVSTTSESDDEDEDEDATISVTLYNYTDYDFQELYYSPVDEDDWSQIRLGRERILESYSSIDIDLPDLAGHLYDIKIVDEDYDDYEFTEVKLKNRTELTITFDGSLMATSVFRNGDEEYVYGTLNGESTQYSSGGSSSSGSYGDADYYGFDIYNESDYEIYSIMIGPSAGAASGDIDVLPSTLASWDSYYVSGYASDYGWDGDDEWTIYVTDVDGDTSLAYDNFNPYTVLWIDIHWDDAQGGYVSEATY